MAGLDARNRQIDLPRDDPRYANLGRQQEERQLREERRRSDRTPIHHEQPRTSAGYPSAQSDSVAEQERYLLYQRHQERRRREALEANSSGLQDDSAAIKSVLARGKSQRQLEVPTMSFRRKLEQGSLEHPSALKQSATAPLERKSSKLVQAIGDILSGLDVKARKWEAPSDEVVEARRAREALLSKQKKEAEDLIALEALVGDVRLKGTKNSDLATIFQAVVDRKTSAEEARKRLEALKAGKPWDGKDELSLAEQERRALIEHEATRLTVIKLVRTWLILRFIA